MDEHQLDGLVASRRVNVRYVTDFDGITTRNLEWRSFAVWSRKNGVTLVIMGLELARLARYPASAEQVIVFGRNIGGNINHWGKVDDPSNFTELERKWVEQEDDVDVVEGIAMEALHHAVEAAGLSKGRVGFDDMRIAGYMADLGLTGIKPVEAVNIFRQIRMVKTDAELELMAHAAKINEQAALNAVHRALKPGASWFDVENAWASELCARGGRPIYLSTGTSEGRTWKLEPGETITVDGLGTYLGYHADFGRTAIIGEPRADQLAQYNALRAGFHDVYPQLKPGMTSSEISKLVVSAAKEAGLKTLNGVTPHSIGLEHTDHPIPFATDPPGTHLPWVLQPNVAFNIDMPYGELGWGKLHLEDTIVGTDTGVRALTSMQTEMIQVPIS